MNKKSSVLKIIFLFVNMTLSSHVFAASTFVQAKGQWGILIVNQLNGNITYCVGQQASFGTPNKNCAKIGQISTVSLAGNVQIDIPSVNYTLGFITNTATGVIVECALVHDTYTGAPLGGCVTQQAQ